MKDALKYSMQGMWGMDTDGGAFALCGNNQKNLHMAKPLIDPLSLTDFTGLFVIVSWGKGWDHVSVSRNDRTPTWDEMEMAKRFAFKDDEVAMQLHVPPKDHVNRHNFCLHLWRPQTAAIPMPPKEYV